MESMVSGVGVESVDVDAAGAEGVEKKAKKGKSKVVTISAERQEKLERLKKTAMRVNVGIHMAKIASDAHQKILAQLFRDAIMLNREARTPTDLKIMSKIFSMCPQLQGFVDKKLLEFCKLVTAVHYKDGDIIVQEGADSDAYYIIAVGFAKVLVRSSTIGVDGQAEMMQVSRLGPGRAFGELGLIYDQPRSANVVADGNLIATRLEKSDYMRLLADFHVQKLFQRIQSKLDFIRRYKAWQSYELRPQFALTYLLTNKSVSDGAVVFDRETDAFDHRFFQDKERYAFRPDLKVYFVHSGNCSVFSEVSYHRRLDPEATTETICVSILTPGTYFGGPATPPNVSRIVARGNVELFETLCEDLIHRMGQDIVPAMCDHCRAQGMWIRERMDAWSAARVSGENELMQLDKITAIGAKQESQQLLLPSVQMQKIGGYSQGPVQKTQLGRAISRPGSRASVGFARSKSSLGLMDASKYAVRGSFVMRLDQEDEDNMDVRGWVSHLEMREEERERKLRAEARQRMALRKKLNVPKKGGRTSNLVEVNRSGAVSAEPALGDSLTPGSTSVHAPLVRGGSVMARAVQRQKSVRSGKSDNLDK